MIDWTIGLSELTETANRLYAERQWQELSVVLRDVRARAPRYWYDWLANEFDATESMGILWADMWMEPEGDLNG